MFKSLMFLRYNSFGRCAYCFQVIYGRLCLCENDTSDFWLNKINRPSFGSLIYLHDSYSDDLSVSAYRISYKDLTSTPLCF